MKTTHFTIAIALGLSAITMSCRAQQLPLNTLMKDIPVNAHVKDLNNELNPYIGTYKANYQGNEITLYITKEEDRPTKLMNKNFYNDVLSIRYIVKNSSGIILQNTQNMSLDDQSYFNILSIGTIPSSGSIAFIYDGTNCGIGWGDIHLKKINNNQISWKYLPDSLVIDEATCPTGTDKKVYLPVTKDLIFTKQ
ncbi:DUF6705 family protein [Chryseobacterium sp. 2R14A]|uniref:DUF6705 family protein n=1 Tax=Chryseobacterium sp. 2R14A TaxID=3380353 RepID=UPI003CF48148